MLPLPVVVDLARHRDDLLGEEDLRGEDLLGQGAEALPPAFCEARIMVFRFSSVSRSTTPMIRFP